MTYKMLILASGSPRRREILSSLGYRFTIEPADIEETIREDLELNAALKDLALQKAKAVFNKKPDAVILAADTVVILDGKILGKPKDRDQARQMLQSLSGRGHEVKTALCVLEENHTYQTVITSGVHFRPLSPQDIEAYLDRNTWQDKAGGYGIQETDFVSLVQGSSSNVIGLPMHVTDWILKDIQSDPNVRF